MSNERVDEVSKYYRVADILESVQKPLYWTSAFLSLVIPHMGKDSCLKVFLAPVFVITVIAIFIIGLILKSFLLPMADRKRRQSAISNGFGTSLSHDKTNKYYNNNEVDSFRKFALNLFESSLFSTRICEKTLVKVRLTSVFFVTLWLITILNRSCELGNILFATQIVFSGEILANWINLEALRFRFNRAYDEFHSYFHHSANDVASLVAITMDYETAKPIASIRLSKKVFNKINPEVSEEWGKIKIDLNIGI